MEHRWNKIDRGKPKNWGKPSPSATWSTTNPTWTDPGSNPGLCGGRPVANHLSHGTAYVSFNYYHITFHPSANTSTDTALNTVVLPQWIWTATLPLMALKTHRGNRAQGGCTSTKAVRCLGDRDPTQCPSLWGMVVVGSMQTRRQWCKYQKCIDNGM
jgi:hypothetical protein